MVRNYIVVVFVFGLGGCISQSQIQSKYVKAQNICREESARTVGVDNQAGIGAAFSECMNKGGWHVASPKTGVVTNNPPTGSPSTNPSAATASARVAPTGQPKTGAEAAAANPPSGAPSVKPSAAVGAASVPAPANNVPAGATYQPARPLSVSTPSDAAGAGRQF